MTVPNVVLDFVNSDEACSLLGDAYRVEARIVLWEAANVLKIPTSALFRHGARGAVYVASSGRARRTIIELGQHNGQEAEVVSGLTEGATVIVHPEDLVRDGVRISDRSPDRSQPSGAGESLR